MTTFPPLLVGSRSSADLLNEILTTFPLEDFHSIVSFDAVGKQYADLIAVPLCKHVLLANDAKSLKNPCLLVCFVESDIKHKTFLDEIESLKSHDDQIIGIIYIMGFIIKENEHGFLNRWKALYFLKDHDKSLVKLPRNEHKSSQSTILQPYIFQINSNSPGEDRFSCKITEAIAVYSIIDGHGGSLACDIAINILPDLLIQHISASNSSGDREFPAYKIVEAINNAFLNCDDIIHDEASSILQMHDMTDSQQETDLTNKILERPRILPHEKLKDILSTKKHVGFAGACAVIVVRVYDQVFVAHVGDCRAVLVSRVNASTIQTMMTARTSQQPKPVDTLTDVDVLQEERLQPTIIQQQQQRQQQQGLPSTFPSSPETASADRYKRKLQSESSDCDSSPVIELDQTSQFQHQPQQPVEKNIGRKRQKVKQSHRRVRVPTPSDTDDGDDGDDASHIKSKEKGEIGGEEESMTPQLTVEIPYEVTHTMSPEPRLLASPIARTKFIPVSSLKNEFIVTDLFLGEGGGGDDGALVLSVPPPQSLQEGSLAQKISQRRLTRLQESQQLTRSHAEDDLDGLWNYLTAEDVLYILREAIQRIDDTIDQKIITSEDSETTIDVAIRSTSSSIAKTRHYYGRKQTQNLTRSSSSMDPNYEEIEQNLAKILVTRCLELAGLTRGLDVDEVLAIPPGPGRRQIIDDITVMVLLAR